MKYKINNFIYASFWNEIKAWNIFFFKKTNIFNEYNLS
jgi:hypothetical protein